MNSVREYALLASRRASSCPLKGMFLNIEGPLLVSSLSSWRFFPLLIPHGMWRNHRQSLILSVCMFNVLMPYISIFVGKIL